MHIVRRAVTTAPCQSSFAKRKLCKHSVLCLRGDPAHTTTLKESIMKPTVVISHIVCSLTLVTSIVVGFNGMNEYGVAPLWALLTLGGSFLLGFQLMLIITGE